MSQQDTTQPAPTKRRIKSKTEKQAEDVQTGKVVLSPAALVAQEQAKRMAKKQTTRHTLSATRNKGFELGLALFSPLYVGRVPEDGAVGVPEALAWLVAPSLVDPSIAATLAPVMNEIRAKQGREAQYYTGKGFLAAGIRDGAGQHSWAAVRDAMLEGVNEAAVAHGQEAVLATDFTAAMKLLGRTSTGAVPAE